MPAYHQMGHHTENLVGEVDGYAGVILSPVNSDPSAATETSQSSSQKQLDVVFDPQLYFPKSERGQLRKWSYFPTDFDTTDFTSESWWLTLLTALAREASALGATKICSPAIVPSATSDDYYVTTVKAANRLVDLLGSADKTLLTVWARLSELASSDRVMRTASIASSTEAGGVYLVLQSDVSPRLELSDPEQLKGAMRLIHALEFAGLPVLVGFSGPEVILWKAAGASSAATGKFFNLRRFTPGRFEDPQGGGGQLPYWFEESLLASLRESDLTRLMAGGLLDESPSNPFAAQILEQIRSSTGKAWVALGWRQYMHWFADAQRRIDAKELQVGPLLKDAEGKWERLNDSDLLMEEVKNDGKWLRPWRRALAEFNRPPVG